MIKHIVLFKVKDEFKPEVAEMINKFMKMKSEIPGLLDFSVGTDFVRSARSYDLGLIATLKDEAALEVYANHPLHLPLKNHMAEISDAVASVDFVE